MIFASFAVKTNNWRFTIKFQRQFLVEAKHPVQKQGLPYSKIKLTLFNENVSPQEGFVYVKGFFSQCIVSRIESIEFVLKMKNEVV